MYFRFSRRRHIFTCLYARMAYAHVSDSPRGHSRSQSLTYTVALFAEPVGIFFSDTKSIIAILFEEMLTVTSASDEEVS